MALPILSVKLRRAASSDACLLYAAPDLTSGTAIAPSRNASFLVPDLNHCSSLVNISIKHKINKLCANIQLFAVYVPVFMCFAYI